MSFELLCCLPRGPHLHNNNPPTIHTYKHTDEVWLHQQNKGGWRQHPRAADALAKNRISPDCVNLLDGLLCYEEVRVSEARERVYVCWCVIDDDLVMW